METITFSPIWPTEGKNILQFKNLFVDCSFVQFGYFYAWTNLSNKKLKLRVMKDKKVYNYDLPCNGAKEIFPLQCGNGAYRITLNQARVGSFYAKIAEVRVDVALESKYAPFLCPSQYVNYEQTDKVVEKAKELCGNLESDVEKIDAIRDFIKKGFVYDYVRAITIAENYLGDAKKCLDTRIGLCLDFSVLFAAMARSQGIPTKLIIGHADLGYHAWNEVFLNGEWTTIDSTADITHNKVKVYRTERVY